MSKLIVSMKKINKADKTEKAILGQDNWQDFLGVELDFMTYLEQGLKEYELAEWIDEQRRAYAKGEWTAEQVDKLESLPNWTWTLTEEEKGISNSFLV